MPLYTYICPSNHTTDIVAKAGENPKSIECHCGRYAGRLFKAPQVAIFKPYTTTHITGEPIEIRTASQEEAICRANNVYRMLDSEKIDKNASRRKREQLKKQTLEARPWEECIARAEAETGQKLITPDKPRKKRTCKSAAVV